MIFDFPSSGHDWQGGCSSNAGLRGFVAIAILSPRNDALVNNKAR